MVISDCTGQGEMLKKSQAQQKPASTIGSHFYTFLCPCLVFFNEFQALKKYSSYADLIVISINWTIPMLLAKKQSKFWKYVKIPVHYQNTCNITGWIMENLLFVKKKTKKIRAREWIQSTIAISNSALDESRFRTLNRKSPFAEPHRIREFLFFSFFENARKNWEKSIATHAQFWPVIEINAIS